MLYNLIIHYAAHIGFEQALYTVSEMEGSIDACVNVLTGPVIDSLIVSVQVMSSSASGEPSNF